MFDSLKAQISDELAKGNTVIVAPFHSDKIEYEGEVPDELQANPPMNQSGMEKIFGLVGALREFGTYTALVASRQSRALDAASVFANEYDLDIRTHGPWGQNANKTADGRVVWHPAHTGENYDTWQNGGVVTAIWIDNEFCGQLVLAVGHRPVIGGLIAHCNGVVDINEIKRIVNDATLTEHGFQVFVADENGIRHLGPYEYVAVT